MPLGMHVGLSPGDFVLDGDPVLAPKRGGAPSKNSAHVYCSQTARWIKVPRDMKVGLSPGDFVLDGDPAPLPKQGTEAGVEPLPIFGPCLLWRNGWMDQDGN